MTQKRSKTDIVAGCRSITGIDISQNLFIHNEKSFRSCTTLSRTGVDIVTVSNRGKLWSPPRVHENLHKPFHERSVWSVMWKSVKVPRVRGVQSLLKIQIYPYWLMENGWKWNYVTYWSHWQGCASGMNYWTWKVERCVLFQFFQTRLRM